MNKVYKVSILRVVDKNKLVSKLSDKQKEIALEKYAETYKNNYVNVSFVSGAFILCDNPELFYVYLQKKVQIINVVIEDGKEKDIVDSLLFRAKKEVLNPMLAAFIYNEIKEIGGYSQELIANSIGKTQGAISNKSRLLKLPINVQNAIIKGEIKERHGRAMLKLNKLDNFEDKTNIVLDKVIADNLLVDETEDIIDTMLGKVVGKRENLNIKSLGENNEIKQKTAKIIINEFNKEMDGLEQKLQTYFPNLVFERQEGIVKDDYVFLIKMKGVNK